MRRTDGDDPRAAARAAIRAAFPETPVPDAGAIVGDPGHERDRAGAEALRAALAGRRWTALDAPLLADQWAAFCYLSPEGYRYYLPALLDAALETFDENGDFEHAVVYGLRPSFGALDYEGGDRRFAERLDAMTAAQQDAVAGFLGLVLERLPRLRDGAAKALRWGWNRRETPALAAALAYYRPFYSYTHPDPPDPAARAVADAIRAGFADTPYPGDDRLCGSRQGDEPAEYALELRGARWQGVHPDLLALCAPALAFLSDEGFRYFLPAFLLADVTGEAIQAEPVWYLTEGRGVRGGSERFGIFTPGERAAVVRYLEYRLADGDPFDAPAIRAALDEFWRAGAGEDANPGTLRAWTIP